MLGKEVYDLAILDPTMDQLMDWGASLGAGRPKLALSILAYEYKDRDWDTDDAPDIEMYVAESNNQLAEGGKDLNNTAPHELLETFYFSKYFKKSAPANVFGEATIKTALEQHFIDALLYGLSHSAEYENWYENYLQEHLDNKDTYEKMGLDMEELPSLEQSYVNAEAIIDAYQQELDISFPKPHAKLLHAVQNIR